MLIATSFLSLLILITYFSIISLVINMDIIVNKLFNIQEIKYKDFTSKLIPNIDKEKIIGVRIPQT